MINPIENHSDADFLLENLWYFFFAESPYQASKILMACPFFSSARPPP